MIIWSQIIIILSFFPRRYYFLYRLHYYISRNDEYSKNNYFLCGGHIVIDAILYQGQDITKNSKTKSKLYRHAPYVFIKFRL